MTRPDAVPTSDLQRCPWAGADSRMHAYHDEEWGVPERSGRALWEKLMLDVFQAGLSLSTILNKLDSFLSSFLWFFPLIVAKFDQSFIARLLCFPSFVLSRSFFYSSLPCALAYLSFFLSFFRFLSLLS